MLKFFFNQTVVYKLDTEKIKCKSNNWFKHVKFLECSYPETVGNGTLNVTGVIYGDNITYTCNLGYHHGGGDLFRTCGRDRQWSGIIPACICMYNSYVNDVPLPL